MTKAGILQALYFEKQMTMAEIRRLFKIRTRAYAFKAIKPGLDDSIKPWQRRSDVEKTRFRIAAENVLHNMQSNVT